MTLNKVRRIAILGRGVHTLPSYRALVNRLAVNYCVTVYSEVPCRQEWMELDHRYSFRCVPGLKFSKRLTYLSLFFLVLGDHFKKPFDLLHSHSTYPTGLLAILLRKILNVPVLLSLDGGEATAIPAIHFGDLLSKRRKMLNAWVTKEADSVTALTFFQRDDVIKNLQIKRAIHVIPRGIVLSAFPLVEKASKSPIVFLHVGYLSPVKDPVTLVKTFDIIQQKVDALLIHVGQDYMNGEIQALVAQMNISDKVFFKGNVPYEHISSYYSQADILLMTSRYESQAVVVAEALAAGLLVCGTHVGLMADLAGECCITAPVGDAELLAALVLETLQDNSKKEALRRNGLTWSKQNNLDQTVVRMQEIYDQLILKR